MHFWAGWGSQSSKKDKSDNSPADNLQRVLIARALAVEPRILVLDEPTASVDSASKTRIYEILKELNQEITILIVTHDLSAVSSNI